MASCGLPQHPSANIQEVLCCSLGRVQACLQEAYGESEARSSASLCFDNWGFLLRDSQDGEFDMIWVSVSYHSNEWILSCSQ